MSNSGRVLWCGALLALAIVVASAAPKLPEASSAAAKVDGKVITVGDLEAECAARFGAETLAQMIQYQVVDAAAKKRDIKVTEKEIVDRIKTLQISIELQKRKTGQGFQDWMRQRRISL
ncbi:MAG: hypothetical protein J7M26_03175, partial [Armatimonadetes bacterium]|nr:hypothetical protein [Armatimonadota bacterium]